MDLFENCESHGQYAAYEIDSNGIKRFRPTCPACRSESKTKLAIGRSAIPKRFRQKTFESYNAQSYQQKHALDICKAYADNFKHTVNIGQSMIFVGNPGSGKTHLACAIANKILLDNHTALFISVSDLIRAVRQSWSKSASKTEAQVLDEICGVDLLIMDEVGVQYGSDSEQITIFEVINRRYNDCKPMIVLSNLGLTAEDGKKSLRDYLGDRAFDRLREGGGKAIRFNWGSYRGQETAF